MIEAGAALVVATASATLADSTGTASAGMRGGAAAPVAPPMQHSACAQ